MSITESPQTGPYRLTHQYDVWNNLTSRNGRYWTETKNFTTTYNSQNHREGWTYDAAGNLLSEPANQYSYDAAGRNVSAGAGSASTQAFDGLGQAIKRNYFIDQGTYLESRISYYLYSTPLGGKVLTELWGKPGQSVPVGTKIRSYVYAGGAVIAKQENYYTHSSVEWQHFDDLTGSLAASYYVTTNNGNFAARREPDPMGADVGLNDPLQVPPQPEPGEAQFLAGGGDFFPDGRCTVDGMMKSELVEAGEGTPSGAQGAGVYGHILFSGGSWLAGKGSPVGYYANVANEIKDRGQGLFGSDQYSSEIAGNQAGRAVGRHLWNYLSGSKPINENALRKDLTSVLCSEPRK